MFSKQANQADAIGLTGKCLCAINNRRMMRIFSDPEQQAVSSGELRRHGVREAGQDQSAASS